jgi:TRAP-type C4-dicarboxylate transport system substrate-binding protein
VIIGWLGLVAFKLAEVTDHHLVIGLGSGGGFLLMNKAAYDKLPGHAKAALDKHSGYEASRDAFGAALDRIYANSQAVVRGQPNQTISTVPPADQADLRQSSLATGPEYPSQNVRHIGPSKSRPSCSR